MPVYLPTAVLGNERTLLSLGHSGEIMGWFFPSKDHAQNVHECMPAVYFGEAHSGRLSWTWSDEWSRNQEYVGHSNVCVTTLEGPVGVHLQFTDVTPEEGAALIRRIRVENGSPNQQTLSIFLYGDWNLGTVRTGNALYYDREAACLVQSHRDVALAVGGDAVESWHCGKAGMEWGNNARYAIESGALHCQDLEIGDVNWAVGFRVELPPGGSVERTLVFSLAERQCDAVEQLQSFTSSGFVREHERRLDGDRERLRPGERKLEETGGRELLSNELLQAYRRSLLCLPLLCGTEGAALAAPEFDPEFISCGGYGYLWPRDGGEYVSGLLRAGYPEFAGRFFEWCAKHQDESGLWHQRYFLNGQPGPNWCMPPDMLQIDQVGAVLWAYGRWREHHSPGAEKRSVELPHTEMIRRAADYLVSRIGARGVHENAFDTWESFIGSFTYSNAAIYAALRTAARVLFEEKYDRAAETIKAAVLTHFVSGDFLVRGADHRGGKDCTVDSSALGAIDPFGLLDLTVPSELALAEGTLREITERLEVDWEGGRAIRRFEGDAYVGGVPACVNTLWMARGCLQVAFRLHDLGRLQDAGALVERASGYLTTVLARATPTGLLPELMQGPTGQRYWAAPHGWAMASFVTGVLMLAEARSRNARAPAIQTR